MTIWTLSGYLSPSEQPPTFLVPTFTRHGSNELFAQNLDSCSRIVEFRQIDPRLFYNVPELPAVTSRWIGARGLLAYWKEEGGVLLGEAADLDGLLSGHMTDDPFAKLEIGAFLGDDARRLEAIDEIVALLSNRDIAQHWRSQEVTALARPVIIDQNQHDYDSLSSDSREDEFRRLLTEKDERTWAEIWNELWNSGYKRADLEDIAFWWTDLGPGKGPFANTVHLTLARQGADDRLVTYSSLWLSSNEISSANWSTIWIALHARFRSSHHNLRDLAFSHLRHSIDSMIRAPYAWCVIWYQLWLRYSRTECLNLAAAAWRRTRSVSRTFADFVLDPALSDSSCPAELVDAARHWLERDMRSVVLWASIFLKCYEKEPSGALAHLGRIWLSHHGGNVNIWRDVWNSLQPHMDAATSFQVARGWLARSRWDLSAWPRVYNDLIKNPEFKNNLADLISLGNSWLNYQSHFPANRRKIQRSVEYLIALQV